MQKKLAMFGGESLRILYVSLHTHDAAISLASQTGMIFLLQLGFSRLNDKRETTVWLARLAMQLYSPFHLMGSRIASRK